MALSVFADSCQAWLSGTHSRRRRHPMVYENFGAQVVGSTVTFNLFVPNPSDFGNPEIKTVQVVGDFLPGGAWRVHEAPTLTPEVIGGDVLCRHEQTALDQGFYQYKYVITYVDDPTTRWISDPCTRQVAGSENAGFVIGDPADEARPLATPRPLDDLVIYELMIDDFTAEFRAGRAPLDAVHDKLDHPGTPR